MNVGETCTSGVATSWARAVSGIEAVPGCALLTTVRVPLTSPTVVVLKPTLTVHDSPGPRFTGQLLTTVNGALAEMLEKERTALPVLRSVTVRKTGAAPATYGPKSTAAGTCSCAN